MSNVADEDSGPGGVISLVIENEVSGKALAQEASKASRLLSRPDDDDDDDVDNDDELFLDAVVDDDDFLVPLEVVVVVVVLPDDDELPMIAPPAPPPTLPRAVVGNIVITSPGMRSSVVDILLFCLRT